MELEDLPALVVLRAQLRRELRRERQGDRREIREERVEARAIERRELAGATDGRNLGGASVAGEQVHVTPAIARVDARARLRVTEVHLEVRRARRDDDELRRVRRHVERRSLGQIVRLEARRDAADLVRPEQLEDRQPPEHRFERLAHPRRAAISSGESAIVRAAQFSSRCSSELVPGIGSMTGERASK